MCFLKEFRNISSFVLNSNNEKIKPEEWKIFQKCSDNNITFFILLPGYYIKRGFLSIEFIKNIYKRMNKIFVFAQKGTDFSIYSNEYINYIYNPSTKNLTEFKKLINTRYAKKLPINGALISDFIITRLEADEPLKIKYTSIPNELYVSNNELYEKLDKLFFSNNEKNIIENIIDGKYNFLEYKNGEYIYKKDKQYCNFCREECSENLSFHFGLSGNVIHNSKCSDNYKIDEIIVQNDLKKIMNEEKPPEYLVVDDYCEKDMKEYEFNKFDTIFSIGNMRQNKTIFKFIKEIFVQFKRFKICYDINNSKNNTSI